MNIKRGLQTWLPLLLILLAVLTNSQRPSVRQARLDAKLVAAVHSHDTDMAIDALNAGANPNVRDYYRPLPTMLIRLRHPDAAREDDQVHAYEWEPVLSSAVIFGWEGRSSNRNIKIVQVLLKSGADVKQRDFQGSTSLSCAVRQGDIRLAKGLLDYGAAVNTQDQDGYTPLMSTGFPLSAPLTRLRSSRGADPNLQTSDGTTALMEVCCFRRLDIARLLTDYGADPALQRNIGKARKLNALQLELSRRVPDPRVVHFLKQAEH